MYKQLLLLFLGCLSTVQARESYRDSTATSAEEISMQAFIDSIEQSYHYQTGVIKLGDGLATLTIPEHFKYLDSEQSKKVLTELWGNPPAETLGLLFPENATLLGDEDGYVVEISYAEDGYIEDEDAQDLDYNDLMEEMQNDAQSANPQRIEMGYEPIDLIGWAAEPFYDEENKKLHWAKELRFGEADFNTLNYNIRVLGRKGYLTLNVISGIEQLPQVNNDMEVILGSVDFNEGYRYSDFNPDLDEVAAYGVGGLIAGKILAKTGLLAGLLKFWKVIALGAVGIFGALRKRIFGSRSNNEG